MIKNDSYVYNKKKKKTIKDHKSKKKEMTNMKSNCRNSMKKNYFFSMSVIIIHNLLSDKKSRSITIFNEIVNIYVLFLHSSMHSCILLKKYMYIKINIHIYI